MIAYVQFILKAKKGEFKKFTVGTLAKVKGLRTQWLSLSQPYKEFTGAAKESLKLIDDNSDVETLGEACGYHIQCYRKFTDVSKFE